MSKVAINENVMLWALDRSSLTVEDLEGKHPKIKQWISGANHPTLRQLEALAKATRTPLGLFFLDEPPQESLPIPHFRTIDDDPIKSSPDLLETIQIMQRRQSWMRDYLIDAGQQKLPFVNSANIDVSPLTIADSIRATLNLDEAWASQQSTWTDALRSLREVMEEASILVFVNGVVGNNTRRKLDPGEFRGFVLVDEYAPLVFINGADGKAAQMFTLAHELVHVFLGSSAAFDLREMHPADDPMELLCNQTAAEFLVPESKLSGIWPSIRNKREPFQAIAKEFKVSAIVAARRALDLNLINRDGFLEFYNEYQRDERRVTARRPPGGNFYATQNTRIGQRFASTIMRAAKEGKLLFSEAYRLTGIYGKTFDKYASELWPGGTR